MPQNSSRNHLLLTLHTVIPEPSEKGLFREWIGLAKDEDWRNNKIDGFFDKSWEQDEENEETEENVEELEERAIEMEERDDTERDDTDDVGRREDKNMKFTPLARTTSYTRYACSRRIRNKIKSSGPSLRITN